MLLLVLAVFTKCAQVPFSVWLPLAMAAPTPISALVHSSTLVVAGVVLFMRLGLFSSHLGGYVLVVCTMTFVLSALGAVFESDLKRLVAMSTMSHVSLMLIACVLVPSLGIAHMCMHALFKSLLFIAVGYVLHVGCGSQSARGGGTSDSFVLFVVTVCVLRLCGLSLLSGFWSKHVLLEASCSLAGVALGAALRFGIVCSVFYRVRIMWCFVASRPCGSSSCVVPTCGGGFIVAYRFVDAVLVAAMVFGLVLLAVMVVTCSLVFGPVFAALDMCVAWFGALIEASWRWFGGAQSGELGWLYGAGGVAGGVGVVRAGTVRDVCGVCLAAMLGRWVL